MICLYFVFSIANRGMVSQLSDVSEQMGKNNVSFLSYFISGNTQACLDLLIRTNRLPEASFFAR